MSIRPHCDITAGMAELVGNISRTVSLAIYEDGCVTVAQIMNANLLYACGFTCYFKIVVHGVPGYWKKFVGWLGVI